MAGNSYNILVSNPVTPFTMARSFKACSNGKIFIGKADTDPSAIENQIPVYVESEDGNKNQVPQPIIINSAGYPTYNGQPAKIVTTQNYSMAIYDSYMAQQFYWPNNLKIDGNSGLFRFVGDYEKDILYLTSEFDVIRYEDRFYIPKRDSGLPFKTSGITENTWANDKSNFTVIGDYVLRDEVYSIITPLKGLLGGIDNGIHDSLILQQALKGGNKTVIFPPGEYFMRIPQHVESNTRVVIPLGTTLFNDIRLSDAPEYFNLDAKGNAEPVFINAEHGNPTYSYGYDGDSNILIDGGGKIDGYWRQQRSEYCSSIKISHADNIIIRNIVFDNQWKSHFIELNSTRRGRVTGCQFGYIEKAGSSGNWECINIDYSSQENYPHAGGWDNTPCQDISIDNNTSQANEALVGSHTYIKDKPHTNITVYANKGYPGTKSSDSSAYNNGGVVKALYWKQADVFGNVWTVKTISFDFVRSELCENISIHSNRLVSLDLTTKGNNTGIYCLNNNRCDVFDNAIIGPFSYGFLTKGCTDTRHYGNKSHRAYNRAFQFESCTELDTHSNSQGWAFTNLNNGFLTEFVKCDKLKIRSLSQSIIEEETITTQATCSLLIRECTNVYELNYASIDDFPYSKSSNKAQLFKEIKIIKAGNTSSLIPSFDTDIQCLGNSEVLYKATDTNTSTTVKLSRSILGYHSLKIFIGKNTEGPTWQALDLVQSYGDTIAADNVLYVPYAPTIDAATGALTQLGTKMTISNDGLTLSFSNAAYIKAVVANKDGYTSYSS